MRLMKKAATATVVCILSACVLTACADYQPGTSTGIEPTATPGASVSNSNSGSNGDSSDKGIIAPTATPVPEATTTPEATATPTPTPTPAAESTAVKKLQEIVDALNNNKYYEEVIIPSEPGTKHIQAACGEKFYSKNVDLATNQITGIGWEDETYEYNMIAQVVDGVIQEDTITLVKSKKTEVSTHVSITDLQILSTETVVKNGTTYSCVTATLCENGRTYTGKFYFDATTMELKYTEDVASSGNATYYFCFKTSFDESILDPTKSGYTIIDEEETESANS